MYIPTLTVLDTRRYLTDDSAFLFFDTTPNLGIIKGSDRELKFLAAIAPLVSTSTMFGIVTRKLLTSLARVTLSIKKTTLALRSML